MDFSSLNSAVLDVFGEDPGTSPVTIDGVPVQAIYDSRHFASEDGEAGSSDLITTITVPTAAIDGITDAAVVVVRGKTYRIWEPRPDGQGMTVLALERAEPSADLDQVENSYIAALIEEEDN
jgi:hypothetical protein